MSNLSWCCCCCWRCCCCRCCCCCCRCCWCCRCCLLLVLLAAAAAGRAEQVLGWAGVWAGSRRARLLTTEPNSGGSAGDSHPPGRAGRQRVGAAELARAHTLPGVTPAHRSNRHPTNLHPLLRRLPAGPPLAGRAARQGQEAWLRQHHPGAPPPAARRARRQPRGAGPRAARRHQHPHPGQRSGHCHRGHAAHRSGPRPAGDGLAAAAAGGAGRGRRGGGHAGTHRLALRLQTPSSPGSPFTPLLRPVFPPPPSGSRRRAALCSCSSQPYSLPTASPSAAPLAP